MKKNTVPGEKHLTASVWLVTEQLPKRALLVYHKKNKTWCQVGGHVELNENPIEAAVRETREESGVDISAFLSKIKGYGECKELPIPDFFLEEPIPEHGTEPAHFHLDLMYIYTIPHQKVIQEEEAALGIGWFTLEEALKLPLFDNSRIILKKVLSEK